MSSKKEQNNFHALQSFGRSIKNLTPNSEIITGKVFVKYSWLGYEKEIETTIMISLNSYRFPSLRLVEKDWLDAETLYTEFQTGYNTFNYNDVNKTLNISCDTTSKLGASYSVAFKEI